MKVLLPGGAGLVGLNLIALLREQHPDWRMLVVDKKSAAVAIGEKLFPEAIFLAEDLTESLDVEWPSAIQDCDACVMLQAEIGNTDPTQFARNDEFEVIDWPAIFHVSATPLAKALAITHQDPRYSQLEMPF